MKIQIGDMVRTPRFLTVKIRAMFESVELAEICGFTEGSDFRDEDYHVRGRHIEDNRMIFAAVKREV